MGSLSLTSLLGAPSRPLHAVAQKQENIVIRFLVQLFNDKRQNTMFD